MALMPTTLELTRNRHNGGGTGVRRRLAELAGLQYGTDRDIYEVAGYDESLEFRDYWDRIQRQDIAARINDLAPKATWRNSPTVTDTPDSEEESEFDRAVQDLVDRTGLWHQMERFDRLLGIGEFGVLLIGQRGDDIRLSDELEQMSSTEDVVFFSAFHQGDTDIVDWISDPGSARFGQPALYEVDISKSVQGFPDMESRVHWSRVIHGAEDLLDDDVYGTPRLMPVMNRLFDLQKVTAATAEAFWQLADKILTVSVDPEARVDSDDFDDLESDLLDITHDLRRHLLAQGIELDLVGGDTPDPSGPFAMLKTLISASRGIPESVLFGSERGDVAQNQDLKAWMGRISARQTWFAGPMLLRPLIDRLQRYGALPDADYVVQWPNLAESDEVEESEVDLNVARAAKNLAGAGGAPDRFVEMDEDGRLELALEGSEQEL